MTSSKRADGIKYPFYDNWKLLKKESTKSIFNLKYKLREYVDEKLIK